MKWRMRMIAGLLLSCAVVPPAFSVESKRSIAVQDRLGGAVSALDVEQELDADLSVFLGDIAAPNEPPYLDLRYRLAVEGVRSDGLRWGGRLELGAVRHDGGRGVGGPASCADACGPQGLATGLYARPGFGGAEPRAGLHRAEVYARHPYAELRAGVTDTAATLERPAPPRSLRLSRADGPLADPFDLNLADTGLSLTAPALGVSVQTRRLAGFRAAASYTGDADPCGLDHCRPGAGLAPDVGAVWSAAVSFDRRRAASGVRWAAYAGAEAGVIDGPTHGVYAEPWVGGLALVREEGPVTLSARWLSSNDGLDPGRYDAAAISAAYEAGDWLYSLEAAQGEASAFGASSVAIFFGASRFVGRNGLAGAGVQIVRQDSRSAFTVEKAALVLEAGLRF